MGLYSPKQFQKLYNYKETIENKEIEEILTQFIKNYNKIYIRLKDLIREKYDKKETYNKIEKISKENKELKDQVDRYKILVKNLLEENKK